MEYYIIGFLTVLLLGSQIFWAVVCLRLTDRLMSRDFAEYKQATKKQTDYTPSRIEDAVDHFAQDMADQANKTLGLI